MNQSLTLVPHSGGGRTCCSHPEEIAEIKCLDQDHSYSTGKTTQELLHWQLPGSETLQSPLLFSSLEAQRDDFYI